MKDYIVRASAANAQIRAFAAVTTELTEEARKRHETSPVATAALGRLLTGGAMMGSMMKNDTDMLTIQIKCSGPIGGLTVTADSKGNVKGYVHEPNVILPPKNGKLDVGGALGQGVMTVIKDMGLKEPYSGQTILQTGEIAEDLTYYFATSEQVPSSVGLGVLMEKDNTVRCAGFTLTIHQNRKPISIGIAGHFQGDLFLTKFPMERQCIAAFLIFIYFFTHGSFLLQSHHLFYDPVRCFHRTHQHQQVEYQFPYIVPHNGHCT